MIGRMEDRHALIPVIFRLTGQADITIEFVIDTGFTGELTLPAGAIQAMGLPFLYNEKVNLADDTDAEVPVHVVTIGWENGERDVRVFGTGSRPLLGTALLDQCELVIQFADNGLVTIDTL